MAQLSNSAAGKLPKQIAEGKERHAAPCTHEVDVVAGAMRKPPTQLREHMVRLGKVGTDHDSKESGTDQLQTSQYCFLPCKRDNRSPQGQKNHEADDYQTAFHGSACKYDAT